jgi:hypothetical protein
MIILLRSLLVLFIAGCGTSDYKYFTGTIEYAYSYNSDALDADSLTRARFVKGVFRYDTLNYQSHFIGKDTATYYYSGKLNKSISKTDGNYECEDYGIANDSVLSYKLYNTDEKVLGYSCKILELQKKNSWVKYYVSDDLRIAPATYKHHRAYNWDFYGEKAGGGLILKMEHRLKIFTLSGLVTNLAMKDKNFTALEIGEEELVKACAGKN